MKGREWIVKGGTLGFSARPLIMGILNVTPDSFSDGGLYENPKNAAEHARNLVAEGAHIIDVGGESTRPGSLPVTVDQELARVLPVVEAVGGLGVPISIDTRRADVAGACLERGAHIVNDVSGLSDPAMAPTVAAAKAGLVIMHTKGSPRDMQSNPSYVDVLAEVREYLSNRAALALGAGVARESIVVDPGLGFGKRTGQGIEDNATLIAGIGHIRQAGYPVLIGASRKTFIGNLAGGQPDDRLEGSLAAAAAAVLLGADVLRVHDVEATVRASKIAAAVRDAPGKPF